MKTFNPRTAVHLALFLVGGTLVLGLAWPLAGVAQQQAADPNKHKHADKSADADKDLAAEVRELQGKIVKLEAALKQGHKGATTAMPNAGGMTGMGMMDDKKMGKAMPGMMGMEGMDRDEMMKMMQMMSGMKGKAMGGMGMEDDGMDMMGMMGMGQSGMKGMGKLKMTSALPGFPGASHIYHVGATGFFLDHPDHVTLTAKQETTLNGIKEKALLDQASAQRKVDEAEQELWTLTASDQPDAAKIETKVRAIEKLRGDKRLAFIRAMGEAGNVLTEEQRQVLLGTATDKTHKGHAPSSN